MAQLSDDVEQMVAALGDVQYVGAYRLFIGQDVVRPDGSVMPAGHYLIDATNKTCTRIEPGEEEHDGPER